MADLKLKSEYVVIEDDRVHYRHFGGKNSKPLLLLHGANFSSLTWEQLGTMQLLVDEGYAPIAVDLPGYGRSHPTHLAPRNWLAQLTDIIAVKKPVIVSPSMSGRYMFPYVIDHPDAVAGIIAVAPVGISSYADKIGDIKVPVLAIWGENDRTVPLTDAKLLVKKVANGSLTVVPGASHAPYMNDAVFFHKAMLDFLPDCF